MSQRRLVLLAAASAAHGVFDAHAAPIDTDLGGFVKFDFAAEGPATPPIRADNALLDGEIHLDANGETDTGITYGGRLQLLPAAKPRDNGTFVEVGWAWGELRLGDYGGAAKDLSIAAPTIGIGQIDGDFDRFGAPSALIAPYALSNDNSTKLTYLSPAVLGFRLGVSYTPELADAGLEIAPRRVSGIDADRNVAELAISSARDIGDTTVTTAAAYAIGSAKRGVDLHDLNGGSLGAKLAWNGLTVGGAFVYDGAATLPPDRRPGHVLTDSVVGEFDAGATYRFGRWGMGLSWAHDYRAASASTDIVAAGCVYRMIQGVTLAADLGRFTQPRGSQVSGTTALIVETAIHF